MEIGECCNFLKWELGIKHLPAHHFFKPFIFQTWLKIRIAWRIFYDTNFKTPLQTFWIRNSRLEALQICVFDQTLQEIVWGFEDP